MSQRHPIVSHFVSKTNQFQCGVVLSDDSAVIKNLTKFHRSRIMSSSFTINLADLNKILTQIKIAETNAGNQDLNPGAVNTAGVDLVTIIGQDAALLPQGLRTVSGIYNHLLPGQELVGAADQPFPRLLPQEMRTGTAAGVDFNGDGIPDFFGAAANAGAVYNPAGSVVDSQPRTISNLIVDQSINNPAAIAAALKLLGSADPTGEAFALVDAGKAAKAAAPNLSAKQATEAAYETALLQSTEAKTQIDIAQAKLTALVAGAADGVADASDVAFATDALNAATASSAAAQAAVRHWWRTPMLHPLIWPQRKATPLP
jgi:hypothetical protein